jgi:hypothetical protein
LIVGDNYHRFVRFRLIHIGQQRPDLLDFHLSIFTPSYCQDGCDRETVMAEYNIIDAGEPRQDLYPFKYALDIDDASFSGRFLRLMRSGSLVFKVNVYCGLNGGNHIPVHNI